MLNPIDPCLTARAGGGEIWAPKWLYRWPCPCGITGGNPHGIFLMVVSFTAGSFPQCTFRVPGISSSWGFHWTLGFTLTASHPAFSQVPCKDCDPVTHFCLGERPCNPVTLTFCMPAKPTSHRWCQGQQPTWAVAELLGSWLQQLLKAWVTE